MVKFWKDVKLGYMQVTEVSDIINKLRGDGELFISTNKYTIYSGKGTYFNDSSNYICLPGTNINRDNDIIEIPLDKFEGAVLAFRQFYNFEINK